MYQAINLKVASGGAGLDFGLSIGTQIQRFRISLEALRDHFDADDVDDNDGLIACFQAYEQTICKKAFAVSPVPPNDDVIVLGTMLF